MIEIDGSEGEGGGQVLRTALALSIVTGRAFRAYNIRARRKNPGLQRQHLAAVRAAREVCGGGVKGDWPGSRELVFGPGPAQPGRYAFDIGSAGSATLVLQTVLYPLWQAGGASEVEIAGGTHNPMAPPFDFIAESFLPWLERAGRGWLPAWNVRGSTPPAAAVCAPKSARKPRPARRGPKNWPVWSFTPG